LPASANIWTVTARQPVLRYAVMFRDYEVGRRPAASSVATTPAWSDGQMA
jgi:hypothetical protein